MISYTSLIWRAKDKERESRNGTRVSARELWRRAGPEATRRRNAKTPTHVEYSTSKRQKYYYIVVDGINGLRLQPRNSAFCWLLCKLL